MRHSFSTLCAVAFVLQICNANAAGVFNDSESFVVARAFKLGRGKAVSIYSNGHLGSVDANKNTIDENGTKTENTFQIPCDKNCASCDTKTGTCSACKSSFKLENNACTYVPSAQDLDTGCLMNCGQGFSYSRPGAKNNGKELVCTKYPKECGYGCTTGWDIDYLVNGTNYTCQTAVQKEDNKSACEKYCGEGFGEPRAGAKNNGQEIVCTKYPKSCGYGCTTGWDIDYLVNGTNYTCQTAIQPDENDTSDAACVKHCGEGFGGARSGSKNNGKEIVCTKYPLSCGYGCTTGWDIDYLVNGTNYTCQTAIQAGEEAECVKHCGDGFGKPRAGAKNGGKEIVCTKYPLSCGYGCTTGWDIDYLVKGSNYTCQTARQSGRDADCVKYCGDGFSYDRPGDKNNGQELVCTKYPKSCGYGCTTGWDIDYLVKGTNYTCQTAVQY